MRISGIISARAEAQSPEVYHLVMILMTFCVKSAGMAETAEEKMEQKQAERIVREARARAEAELREKNARDGE